MARFAALSLLVLLPVVLSAPAEEKKGRSLVVPGGSAVSGAAGAQYGQQTGGSETHDKKNFNLGFSSDRGSSNQFSNTNAAAGVAGGYAQGNYPGSGYYYPQVPYPQYPHYPQYPYPQYPGVGPVVGSGSQVNLPGVNAASGAGTYPNGVGVPIRY